MDWSFYLQQRKLKKRECANLPVPAAPVIPRAHQIHPLNLKNQRRNQRRKRKRRPKNRKRKRRRKGSSILLTVAAAPWSCHFHSSYCTFVGHRQKVLKWKNKKRWLHRQYVLKKFHPSQKTDSSCEGAPCFSSLKRLKGISRPKTRGNERGGVWLTWSMSKMLKKNNDSMCCSCSSRTMYNSQSGYQRRLVITRSGRKIKGRGQRVGTPHLLQAFTLSSSQQWHWFLIWSFSCPVVSNSITVSFEVQRPLSEQWNPSTLASGNSSSENESCHWRALD